MTKPPALGVRPTGRDGVFDVVYGRFLVGHLDLTGEAALAA